jgi:hypothetical protein
MGATFDAHMDEQAAAARRRLGIEPDSAARRATAAKPFYSRLSRAIQAAPFKKGTAEQWRAALTKNVAAGEREWTGVDQFLQNNAGKVLTRGQVQQVFREGAPQIARERLRPGKYGSYSEPGGTDYTETLLHLQDEGPKVLAFTTGSPASGGCVSRTAPLS